MALIRRNQSQIIGGKAFWQEGRVSTHAQKQERNWDVHGTKKRLGSGEEEGGEE